MKKNCRECLQNFEVAQDDLDFYDKVSPVYTGQKYLIPSPTLCPECRRQRRLAFRNERTLYMHTCDLCKKSSISIYSPDKPYIIYCSECWWSDQCDPFRYGQDFDFSRPFFERNCSPKLKAGMEVMLKDRHKR